MTSERLALSSHTTNHKNQDFQIHRCNVPVLCVDTPLLRGHSRLKPGTPDSRAFNYRQILTKYSFYPITFVPNPMQGETKSDVTVQDKNITLNQNMQCILTK